MTYLEYRNGSALKFWRVEVDGDTQTITHGKLSAKKPPKPKSKTFKSAEAAAKSTAKAIAKKRAALYFDPSTIAGILEDHADTLHVHTEDEVAAQRQAYPHAPDPYFEVWRTGALELGLIFEWGPTEARYDGPFYDLAYLFPVNAAAEGSLRGVAGAEALDPFFYLCGQLADGSQLVLINSGANAGKLSLFEHEPPEELVEHIVPGDPEATFRAWHEEGLWPEPALEMPYEEFVRDRLLHHKAGAVEALVALRASLAAIDEAAAGDPLALTTLSLREKSLRMLPESVGAFANVESLDLYNNELTELPAVIRKLTKLRELNLYWQAGRFDAASLPGWISELPLRTLDVANNDCSSFPTALLEMSDLEVLHLGRLDVLPSSISRLANLRELVIGDVGQIEPGALAGLRSLKKLSLGELGGPLPDDVGDLAELEWLGFRGGRGRTLNPAVGRLAKLRCLHSGSTEIPDAIGQLTALETWVCPTHGGALPESVGNLGSLRELNLHYARITALPESIGQLQSLEALIAESAWFTELPESFAQLRNLKLARLNTKGHLPILDRLSSLENLEVLKFNYRSLDTISRATWARLKKLRVLKMYSGFREDGAVEKFAFLRELPSLEECAPPFQLRSILQQAYPDVPIT